MLYCSNLYLKEYKLLLLLLFSKVDADKCSQKWRNLLKEYHQQRRAMSTTGKRRKDPPWFFAEMDSIMHGRPIVTPVAVLDTLSPGCKVRSSCSAVSVANSEGDENGEVDKVDKVNILQQKERVLIQNLFLRLCNRRKQHEKQKMKNCVLC